MNELSLNSCKYFYINLFQLFNHKFGLFSALIKWSSQVQSVKAPDSRKLPEFLPLRVNNVEHIRDKIGMNLKYMTWFLTSLMYPMDVLCSLIRSNCLSLTGLSFLFMALPCSLWLCVYYSSRRLTRPTLWPPCRGGGWGCPWCRRRPCHHESPPRLVQLEPGRRRHGAVQNTVGTFSNIVLHCMPCSGRRFYLRMRNCKRKNQVCTA